MYHRSECWCGTEAVGRSDMHLRSSTTMTKTYWSLKDVGRGDFLAICP